MHVAVDSQHRLVSIDDPVKVRGERRVEWMVVPPPLSACRSVAHGRVLPEPARDWSAARPIVRWLAVCALERCSAGGQGPTRAHLGALTVSGADRKRRVRLARLGDERDLLRAISFLWDQAKAVDPGDPPARVGVVLDKLVESTTMSLFGDDPRSERLQVLLRDVRERYDARALRWGECSDRYGRYTGAKIAYKSFPDAARLRWLGVVGRDT